MDLKETDQNFTSSFTVTANIYTW